jgi:hypothetical protein
MDSKRRGMFGHLVEHLLSFAHGKHACPVADTVHITQTVLKERYLHIYFNAACRLSRTCILLM